MSTDGVRHIGQLTPDPKNARRHNPRNIGMIVDSLQKVGAARSIVIDEEDVILAGNGVIEAAAEAGIESVRVIEASGNEIIAVRRRGLTEEQKTLLKYYDNRTAELADWDAAQIVADLEADVDLSGLWSDEEIAELVAGVIEEPPEAPEPQIDRAEELREKWQTARGQVWEIGKHRLMCGDSTSKEDVAKLMRGVRADLLATDPPYNVGIEYGEGVNDSKAEPDYEAFTRSWFEVWQTVSQRQIVTPGCNNLARWLRYFDPYHVAAWTKANAMTHGKIAQWCCWEPILFFGERWNRTRPNDVFDYPIGKQDGVANHPCPKPLKMWANMLEHYCENTVADAFVGSGTTMVAAEQLGRLCYGMEISPAYVGVTLERLSQMGLIPQLVGNDASG